MLDSNERYPLHHIIVEDLFHANKTIMALLLSIVITALATIWMTHQTRILVAEKGQLVIEHQALENEYLNLKLEEATQSDNTRIEAIAHQFGMKRVQPEQEVLILE
ncbi:cell division protein FtsL [Pasteurella sp. P03HT]|nr:cell division protein FtsL [Pasteurella multocida subsp. multocida OH4807]